MISILHNLFTLAEDQAGIPANTLKLLFSFLLSYPLAALIKRFPDNKPWLKNVYIISVSLFYLLGLFDLWSGLFQLFISAAGAYLIASQVKGPKMPWLGFAFLMGHMSIGHIYRQISDDPDTIDITGAQMVMVMKLSAFCWNVYDGTVEFESLTKYQQDRVIVELPSLLDYAGYVLFFPSLFAGPAFDFSDYAQYLSTSMFELPEGFDLAKAPRTRNGRIPRSGRPAIRKVIIGIAWIGAFIFMSSHFTAELVLGDTFLQYGFVRRVFVLYLLGLTARLRYYGVWTLTEGACIISGLGYNEVDENGKVSWNRLQNIQPMKVEMAQNIHSFLDGWNINTNKWLRNYVYLRVSPVSTGEKGVKNKKSFKALIATFGTSAFWHGFYPGYYFSFILAAFLQPIAQSTRRNIRPFFFEPVKTVASSSKDSTTIVAPSAPKPTQFKPYYDVFTFLFTQSVMAFTVVPFMLLDLHSFLEVWSRVYYFVIVGVVIVKIFMSSPLMKTLHHAAEVRTGQVYKKQQAKTKAAAAKASLLSPLSGTENKNITPSVLVSPAFSSVSAGTPDMAASLPSLSDYPLSDNLDRDEQPVDVTFGVPDQSPSLEDVVRELMAEGGKETLRKMQ